MKGNQAHFRRARPGRLHSLLAWALLVIMSVQNLMLYEIQLQGLAHTHTHDSVTEESEPIDDGQASEHFHAEPGYHWHPIGLTALVTEWLYPDAQELIAGDDAPPIFHALNMPMLHGFEPDRIWVRPEHALPTGPRVLYESVIPTPAERPPNPQAV
jgi:hypothetical protein